MQERWISAIIRHGSYSFTIDCAPPDVFADWASNLLAKLVVGTTIVAKPELTITNIGTWPTEHTGYTSTRRTHLDV